MRVLVVLAAVTLSCALTPTSVSAQRCSTDAFGQFDLAGVYVSATEQMRLEIYPCAAIHLQWGNFIGDHEAVYVSYQRVPGGGVFARGYQPDPYINAYLNGASVIGVKPGVPGYIELYTADRYGSVKGPYTLKKLT